MAKSFILTVDNEHDGVKAGRYLRTVAGLSARCLSVLKRTEGGLTVNGELLRTIDVLKTGDVIEIALPDEVNDITPVEGILDILYEDNSILIVNKPHSMPVHPVKSHQLDTLANIVSFRYRGDESFVFRAVNRLDRDTSGIVIIARDRHTASILQSMDIDKRYIAVCHGILCDSGTIDEPIALSHNSKIVRKVSQEGQKAVTHYSALKLYNDATVVELKLETGRTHQIRCHMSHIGHPLYGDDLYGGDISIISRQALHCHKVSFVHPYTNENIEVSCDIPSDINNLIGCLSYEQH